ncbi:hypothetical protein JL720_6728 [Aureococcus anophagefferens]|nr:hypothetical protein JL720_6728 [Aureococcus anophagefferens]
MANPAFAAENASSDESSDGDDSSDESTASSERPDALAALNEAEAPALSPRVRWGRRPRPRECVDRACHRVKFLADQSLAEGVEPAVFVGAQIAVLRRVQRDADATSDRLAAAETVKKPDDDANDDGEEPEPVFDIHEPIYPPLQVAINVRCMEEDEDASLEDGDYAEHTMELSPSPQALKKLLEVLQNTLLCALATVPTLDRHEQLAYLFAMNCKPPLKEDQEVKEAKRNRDGWVLWIMRKVPGLGDILRSLVVSSEEIMQSMMTTSDDLGTVDRQGKRSSTLMIATARASINLTRGSLKKQHPANVRGTGLDELRSLAAAAAAADGEPAKVPRDRRWLGQHWVTVLASDGVYRERSALMRAASKLSVPSALDNFFDQLGLLKELSGDWDRLEETYEETASLHKFLKSQGMTSNRNARVKRRTYDQCLRKLSLMNEVGALKNLHVKLVGNEEGLTSLEESKDQWSQIDLSLRDCVVHGSKRRNHFRTILRSRCSELHRSIRAILNAADEGILGGGVGPAAALAHLRDLTTRHGIARGQAAKLVGYQKLYNSHFHGGTLDRGGIRGGGLAVMRESDEESESESEEESDANESSSMDDDDDGGGGGGGGADDVRLNVGDLLDGGLVKNASKVAAVVYESEIYRALSDLDAAANDAWPEGSHRGVQLATSTAPVLQYSAAEKVSYFQDFAGPRGPLRLGCVKCREAVRAWATKPPPDAPPGVSGKAKARRRR